ncbi:MAG: 3-dehydroquinate synthase, partial [Candidatus Rokubacteria bacterium]|nr:3-dehydroquinate synthase [Candidatus Rokubacteria bacterium]
MVVKVNLGAHGYAIVDEQGGLATAGRRLRELGVGRRVAVVSSPAILRFHGKTVIESLEEAGFTVSTVEVPDGEAAKTLAVAARCWDALL